MGHQPTCSLRNPTSVLPRSGHRPLNRSGPKRANSGDANQQFGKLRPANRAFIAHFDFAAQYAIIDGHDHWKRSASSKLRDRFTKLTQSSDQHRKLTGEYSTREPAMIKVSVMYPNTPGARFNHEYYREKHMPLVKARMGDACKFYTVDKGLAGGAPGAPATYVGMCHIFCDSIEAFQAGFGPHAKEIMADIPNYTDQSPVIQISEVIVG
jgi:uncharacterized protein (TIGR02118 family)